jgi:protein tyrosine phosphatase (PTP) superfamily phosphohydrolase (DUF442 family)
MYLQRPSRPSPRAAGLLAALLLAGIAILGAPLRAASRAPLPVGDETAAELPGLHNVFHRSEKLYSGSVPEGEAGFRSLQQMGIRTIISVDGMKPDVALARKYGMRYVHLPFGYDGCPAPTASAIVKAVRDLPGPVYIHCHHGLHRSPTAAAFARIALDGLSNEQAVREMEQAGTDKNYTGLYADVRAYRPPSPEALDRLPVEFPEVAPVPVLAATMVRIDDRFSRLVASQKVAWKLMEAKPAYDALQLRELYTELNRTPGLKQRPAEFRKRLAREEEAARALEAALRAGDTARANASLGLLAAGCAACHARYRDVPQGRR